MVLMAVVTLILILYAVLLVKLKPSKETESKSDFKRYSESLEKPTATAETKKIATEPPALSVGAQKISAQPTETIQAKAIVETVENQKTKKDKEEKKSFLLFGEREFEGCAHKFGYLKNLPKNTPIPDECFGCPRIVDCLTTLRNE